MRAFTDKPFPVATSGLRPTVTEVDRIVALTDPVLRNLEITQCYCELSGAFAERAGPGANWCTFATWASKQAGQTIRREDFKLALESLLEKEPEVEEALSLIATLAKELGAQQSLESIRRSALGTIITAVAERASDAVSRGNKKVFEEIGREFARFLATCYNDNTYTPSHLEDFCQQLRPGDPPGGQEYLRRAFTRYYSLLFEEDFGKRCQRRLLANLEIGFHEQTRLQPEIAESLNAASVDPEWVKDRLFAILFPGSNFFTRLLLLFKRLFGKTGLLDKAIGSLVQRTQHHLRMVLTSLLMSLTLPPDNRLRLGQDLVSVYPAPLRELGDQDLLALLKQVDPTPNSLVESGATDWADLPERMHFIAELFRCYQEEKDLFAAAFTAEQLSALKAGKIPGGRL